MLCGGNFGMQLQPHVIELQRIFYTVNPIQVSGGGEQNVWEASGKFGGGQLPPCPDLEPQLRGTRFPSTEFRPAKLQTSCTMFRLKGHLMRFQISINQSINRKEPI